MTRFAQKPWARVRRIVGPDLSDSSLWSAWGHQYQASQIYQDLSGAGRVLQRSGPLSSRQLLLGPSFQESASDQGSCAVSSANYNPPGDCTVAFWCHVIDPAGAADWVFNLYENTSDEWGVRIVSGSPPSIEIYDDLNNANTSLYTTAAPTKLCHVVATIDSSSFEQRLYIDSHLVGSGTAAAKAVSDLTAAVVIAGRAGGSTLNDKGEVIAPAIYSEVKDQAWVTAEYQKGAGAIQFKTDWGHKADGVTKTTDDRFSEVIVCRGGSGRCTTSTINGRTVKVLESQSDSFLAFGQYSGVAPVECSYGSWSWWAYTNGTTYAHVFMSDAAASQMYYIVILADGSGGLYRGPGPVTVEAFAAGTFDVNNPIHLHVTRRHDNRFIVYYNGTALSAGTVDATHTDLPYFVFAQHSGAWTALADEKGQYAFTKYLGVVPPKVN